MWSSVSATLRRPAVLVSIVAAVAALVWWQFPLLTDQDANTDVVVMSDAFLRGQQKPVHDRIQEEGLAMVWDTAATNWCDVAGRLPAVIDVFHPSTIVLSYGSYDGCDSSALADVAAA